MDEFVPKLLGYNVEVEDDTEDYNMVSLCIRRVAGKEGEGHGMKNGQQNKRDE